MKKNLLTLVFSLLWVFRLSGISFSDLNLSSDDRLLFKAEFESQRALFLARLDDLSIQQLTAFPERLQLVDNGRTILALSKFGAVRIPTEGGLPSQLPGLPSFAQGNIPLKGRTEDFAVSSDGRWILFIEPTSPAFGDLYLVETTSGVKWKISERIELPSQDFPVRWSPDSRLFVYSKNGSLFYFPIINDLTVIGDERFRQIGPGGITAVLWGGQGDFFYFLGNTLYRVINTELFTRTIYGDFLSIGDTAASLPFEFESGFDRYWIAPDSNSILINKRGKSIFLFQLGEDQYSNSVLPHIMIPQGAGSVNVLWAPTGQLTIISSLQKETIAWRFETGGNSVRTLASVSAPSSSNGAISPDGTRAVFWGESGLELWNTTTWRLIQKISGESVLSCAWISNSRFITGNEKFIEEITISGSNYPRRRICLSGVVDEFGFEEGARVAQRVLARIGTEWFACDNRNPWTPVTNPIIRNVSTSSERYRVYLENQSSGHFKNIPMIRSAASFVTVSLVSRHSAAGAYTQGQQTRIALCFDLYDDDTGLSFVLSVLRRFNIKATFFMNGDFIRRNPLAAAVIAEEGHEAASLFYAPIDLSDARYMVNDNFIKQGLARNEDEFFRAAGRELSLLWHPPFYRSSALIESAARTSGYITVTRNIDPGDWLSRDEALRLNIRQYNAPEIIEQITGKKENNAVIPVRLGLLSGGRDEYLYQRIDVLLDALIRSGCEIVPVSAIIGR
jgi:peptidoglycan/xylan/chitin deacetylase (PgdA/CDA1 family)